MLRESDRVFTEGDRNHDQQLDNEELQELQKRCADRINCREDRVLHSVICEAIKELKRDPECTYDFAKWQAAVSELL